MRYQGKELNEVCTTRNNPVILKHNHTYLHTVISRSFATPIYFAKPHFSAMILYLQQFIYIGHTPKLGGTQIMGGEHNRQISWTLFQQDL